jgi:hypothetical protein
MGSTALKGSIQKESKTASPGMRNKKDRRQVMTPGVDKTSSPHKVGSPDNKMY